MELATIISQYLKENRRLIIPQLGAFLVKEPDRKIVFSQLLTRDDGLLKSLIMREGASEIEANGLIQQLLFSVRYVAENGGEYILEDVGRFGVDPNGNLLFTATLTTTTEEVEEDVEEEEEEEEEFIETRLEPQEESRESGADPDLEGLVYGGTSPGGFVRGNIKRVTSRKPRKVDWWLIIGIIAILFAIGVILYGFLREGAQSDNAFLYSLLEN
ncbi:MAG: hypothetical protein SNH73_05055 [Rikenellaceae bacterium]